MLRVTNMDLINDLPYELLEMIFTFVPPEQLVAIAAVNTNFHHVSRMENLWKNKVKKHFSDDFTNIEPVQWAHQESFLSPTKRRKVVSYSDESDYWYKAFKTQYLNNYKNEPNFIKPLISMIIESDVVSINHNLNKNYYDLNDFNIYYHNTPLIQLASTICEQPLLNLIYETAKKKHQALTSMTDDNGERPAVRTLCYFNKYSIDGESKTLLHWAVLCGQPNDELDDILKSGIDINSHAIFSPYSSIGYAIKLKNLMAVEYLLNHNAIISSWELPLCVAAQNRDQDMAKILLKKFPDIIDHAGFNQKSPLSIAIEHGDVEMVKLLIENAADLEQVNFENKRPLYLAAEKGFARIVKLLLQAGADTDVKYNDIYSLLYATCKGGSLLTLNTLLSFDAINKNDIWQTPWPVLILIKHGHRNILERLLEMNGNIHPNCPSPYKAAVEYNQLDCLQLLLNHSANQQHQNKRIYEGLIAAAKKGQLLFVKAFVSHGAHLNPRGADKSPLYYAAISSNLGIIQLLVDSGCDVNQVEYNETALFGCVKRGCMASAELLLQLHADPNIPSTNGLCAIHTAAEANKIQLVKLLLSYHANVSQYPISWLDIENAQIKFLLLLKSHIEQNKEVKNDFLFFHLHQSKKISSAEKILDLLLSNKIGFSNNLVQALEYYNIQNPDLMALAREICLTDVPVRGTNLFR